MPTFVYRVRNEKGEKIKGSVDAPSEKVLADRLQREGFLISSIEPVRRLNLNQIKLPGLYWQGVAADDLTMLYFQLGNMLEAGVTLLTVLGTLSGQTENKNLRRAIASLMTKIEGGDSLSSAMTANAALFPQLYRSMVRVGETSGNLGKVLRFVAELNEAKENLRHQIQSALAYPCVLTVASISVVTFMVVWIVPSFVEIFGKSGIPLPLPTRVVYGASLFVKSNVWAIVVVLALSIVGIRYVLRPPPVKFRWDQFWLRVPVVGLLIRRIEVTRWSQSVSMMLSSGVPILEALEVAQGLAHNAVILDAMKKAGKRVEGGERLSGSLEKTKAFPPDVIQMILSGESSGTLDGMLNKVSAFYGDLIGRSLKKLTAMIEPLFILLMGGVIGFIMVSVLLPIFDMIKIFSPK